MNRRFASEHLREVKIHKPFFQRLYTSEYDVCRRQILKSKVDPRTESLILCAMAVDP